MSSVEVLTAGWRARRYSESGTAALDLVAPLVRLGEVESVLLHFDAAPSAGGTVAISVDALGGAAYDTVLYSVDPGAEGAAVTDLFWQPDRAYHLLAGDAVRVTYANADGRTYGCQVTLKEAL